MDGGVRGQGNSKITVKTDTKAEALKLGTQIAKNQQTELTILKKDGRIQNRYLSVAIVAKVFNWWMTKVLIKKPLGILISHLRISKVDLNRRSNGR